MTGKSRPDVYLMTPVAALYIDPRGPYPHLAGVDCWDLKRDARLYDGPWPVVAHPPCGPWGRLRHLYRGAEHDCAPRAVEQVRAFGGVLEHPAGSRLWEACELPPPQYHWAVRIGYRAIVDAFGGYTVELNQCEWGHHARKSTWLYLVNVSREALEPRPYLGREPTAWVSGGRNRSRKGSGGVVPDGVQVCTAVQRRATPPMLAEYLVRLARAAEGR